MSIYKPGDVWSLYLALNSLSPPSYYHQSCKKREMSHRHNFLTNPLISKRTIPMNVMIFHCRWCHHFRLDFSIFARDSLFIELSTGVCYKMNDDAFLPVLRGVTLFDYDGSCKRYSCGISSLKLSKEHYHIIYVVQ